VYKTKPQNLQQLRQRILDESAIIPAILRMQSVVFIYNRLDYYQEVNREQFEHLLK